MGAVAVFVALVVLALATTLVLVAAAIAVAVPSRTRRSVVRTPCSSAPSPSPTRYPPSPVRRPSSPRLRLQSRALFASRSTNAITLDCTLVRAEEGLDLPPHLTPPVGLPFTLQLRPPEAGWFAERVEELLREWAEENRELVLELREDHGRVRTTIASGDSSVYLELAGAAGLTQV